MVVSKQGRYERRAQFPLSRDGRRFAPFSVGKSEQRGVTEEYRSKLAVVSPQSKP